MSKIALEGNIAGSGTLTIAAPNTNSNFTLSLPTNTGTIITQNSTPAFASTIGVGGATAAASGAGITFPATQSASSDANTLDDYEEGTWTATVGVGTVSTGNSGYRKIGSQVTVWIRIDTFSDRSNAGGITVSGLPFSPSLTGAAIGSAMWQFSDINGSTVYVNGGGQLEFYAGTLSTAYSAVKYNSLNNASATVFLVATYAAS